MEKKCVSIMCMALLIAGLMLTASCSKQQELTPVNTGMDRSSSTGSTTSGSGDTGSSSTTDTGSTDTDADWNIGSKQSDEDSSAISARERKADTDKCVNDDIYFDYDSSALTANAQAILMEKAEYMRKYPDTRITVEGHCDERGTFEYNIALGDRRAEGVKAYLVNLGVSAARITTISFGEEKPLDTGHGEASWQKNRRAHFIL